MSPDNVGSGSPILAAGVVLLREGPTGPEALVVHRHRRADWSLPKGKLEPGESAMAAAVRESQEETGFDVVLGPPLTTQYYPVAGRPKTVHYWLARATGRGAWQPDEEVDELRWVSPAEAHTLLTYPRDAELVDEAVASPRGSTPLAILRHAQAEKRHAFAARHRGKPPPDNRRPLNAVGQTQSKALVDILGAYGITRLISSNADRCLATVAPYADVAGTEIEATPALSETGHALDPDAAGDLLRGAFTNAAPTALCSHRPVFQRLHGILLELGGADVRAAWPGPTLAPAGLVIVHRDIRGGSVRTVAVERHEF